MRMKTFDRLLCVKKRIIEMSSKDDGTDFQSDDDSEDFPIPRVARISNPKPAIQPEYEPANDQFNPDLFQLFFSLVNFYLKDYDLSSAQQFSPALETVGTAFEPPESDANNPSSKESKDQPSIMREHIIRKFLIECHSQFLKNTSKPNLSKIAFLYNELLLASDFLRSDCGNTSIVEYCDMLQAETYDLYNSIISQTINEEYWEKNKTAEELINEFLKKEIEYIRILNTDSFKLLSQCAIRRAIEKASPAHSQSILQWARDNKIQFE